MHGNIRADLDVFAKRERIIDRVIGLSFIGNLYPAVDHALRSGAVGYHNIRALRGASNRRDNVDSIVVCGDAVAVHVKRVVLDNIERGNIGILKQGHSVAVLNRIVERVKI